MNYNLIIRENLVNLLGLLLLTTGFITVIGYFDEGHAKIYGNFSNYLASGGYPPLSDYLVWSIMVAISGAILFNIISKQTQRSFPLFTRLLSTALLIPFVMITFLVVFICFIYVFRMFY